MDRIHINYEAYKDAYVQREPVKALFRNENRILLVGEGNFTFTVALVAIREGWDGIVSTRYEADTVKPRPEFDQVQQECIRFCRNNGELLGINDEAIQRYIATIEVVEPPPPNDEHWLFGIDATNTPERLIIQGTVVVFQCPWLRDGDPNGTPATLITRFLEHMATKQNQDDYVLIGITKQFPYVKNYNLEGLLGVNLSRGTDSSGMYNFLGADDTFIQEILKHGYHHQSSHGDRDIHGQIISDHVTLAFQRNGHNN